MRREEHVTAPLTPETALAMALCATEHLNVTTRAQVEKHWRNAIAKHGRLTAEMYGQDAARALALIGFEVVRKGGAT